MSKHPIPYFILSRTLIGQPDSRGLDHRALRLDSTRALRNALLNCDTNTCRLVVPRLQRYSRLHFFKGGLDKIRSASWITGCIGKLVDGYHLCSREPRTYICDATDWKWIEMLEKHPMLPADIKDQNPDAPIR